MFYTAAYSCKLHSNDRWIGDVLLIAVIFVLYCAYRQNTVQLEKTKSFLRCIPDQSDNHYFLHDIYFTFLYMK